jgi:LysW-gamma-L-lysine/LysW-L-ornithine aminotransferase
VSLLAAYPNRGLTFVSGEGPYLVEANGTHYLDLMSSYGVTIFGHRHPALTAALARQLDRLTVLHGSFGSDVRSAAAAALVARCGGGLARAALSSSGTEANEAALKFAALATGKKRFVACRGGYHGKTLGALSATDSPKFRRAFEPLLWEFAFVPYGDAAALEAALDERTAALIVEPVQGESGILTPPAGYLVEAVRSCRARGALTILDEIQTGTGRTGRFLASHAAPLAYDIVTLGKGLAGGIPVGATLVSEAVAAAVPRGAHTSTFGGNPLAAAGILATLGLLDEKVLAQVSSLGAYALERLRSIRSPHIRDVRGSGLMLGLEVDCPRDAVLKGLQAERVLAIPAGDDVIRFLPPFIITEAEIDSLVGALGRVLASPALRSERTCAAS